MIRLSNLCAYICDFWWMYLLANNYVRRRKKKWILIWHLVLIIIRSFLPDKQCSLFKIYYFFSFFFFPSSFFLFCLSCVTFTIHQIAKRTCFNKKKENVRNIKTERHRNKKSLNISWYLTLGFLFLYKKYYFFNKN
jgi:predicted nucleic acid-binding Zn ribbon protein